MKDELQENHLSEDHSEDSVKIARELTESLMGIIPTDLVESHTNWTKSRNQVFGAFYDSLTSEQKEAIRDKDRRLYFTDLTIDQQVYLKQAFHQMWMWHIASAILRPPFYIREIEELKFFLTDDPRKTNHAHMKIVKYSPSPSGRIYQSSIVIPVKAQGSDSEHSG